MIGKNNNYLKIRKEGTKVETYSIKKFKVGTASVVIGASIFFGAGAVAQASEEVSNNTTADNTTNAGEKENVPTAPVATAQPVVKETTKEDVVAAVASKLGEESAKEVKTLDTTKLENYIVEIEAKLANGTYENKTEESVAVLKADLEAAKATLRNAKTQDEITRAYSKLVTTANTKLKAKAVEKKETPAVDTTEGKETVGKKAENTEKKSDSNSIENSGSKDPRNGKEMDKDNAFRTEATAATHEATINKVGNISYTMEFSDDANKEIYLYNQEDTNVGITVNSTAGNISSVKVRGGGNRPLDEATKDSAVQIDGFGWSYTQTVTETAGPVTMNITGKTNEKFLGLANTNRREDQNSVLGARYLVITDAAGGKVEAPSNGSNQPGYFNLVVKSQTYKYSIQQPELNGDKIGVADINNLTAADIQKIKAQINIEYSKTNTDARLTSKKGTVLENKSDVVKNIEISGGNITVTYNDDSTDTATIDSVVRNNTKPTVEIQYSDPAPNKKEVYVYASEVNSFDIKIKDDSGKLASAELRRGSNQSFKDVAGETNKQNTEYGFTANKFTSETTATAENPAVITYTGTPAPEGKFTKEKFEAAIQNGGTPLGWRFVRAIDKDGADARGDGGTAADPTAVNVILKPQTLKYDIKTPEEADKVAVTDASNVTDAEFARVKEKIKLEYSQNNPDERLADKKGTLVDAQEQPSRIQSITRDADNNVVVTYADGSKDKKPLSELVRVNNAPEVKIPYSVDGKKDVYVYANEDVNIDIKYTDDSGKIASAVVNGGGNQPLKVINEDNPNILNNEFDMTEEKISAETPATAENPAIVKIRGLVTKETPGLKAEKFPKGDNDEYRLVTRYATATDTDGQEIVNNATGSSYATDPGAFTIVLKSQTKKYDLRELADTEKPVVTDIANIPADELAKIKENIPLEYSKKNEDKNLADKKGTPVDKADAAKVVDTLVQNGDKLEVTYKDGSKDTIPVDKVVKLDKQPAIDAVNNKATDQITAINNNAALTPAEKEKAIAKVNEDKTAALGKIDEATNNGAIETAKNDGITAVGKVNPVAKEAAKQAVADALKAKNDALDAREDLTQKEIEDAKAAAKAEADKAIVKINEQPDTAPTPAEATTAQTAVDTGKTDGTAAIAKINPIGKQAALDKIDEALKAKEKEIDDRTDLTDEEKKEVKDKAKEIADAKKALINGKKNNADTEAEAGTIQGEINTAGTEGADAITALVKNPAKKPEANTAVTNAAEAKKQSIQDDTALSPEAKKKLQDEVDEIKKASEEAINGAKKNANVDKAKKAAETAIAAINSARLPGNKLVAKNPTNLDAEEQEKLKKAIEAVNPGATVTVNQDGSASVTLPNGKTEPLKQVDLTKDASALETAGGGNNINRPTDKVIVKNPDQLTDEDKEKIKKAVRDVNPNAVVSIDDAGTVTVSTPEGNTAAFPAKELVRTLEDAGKDGSGNVGILKPADKVVGNATNSADQEKATAKLKKLNGADATVKYDAEGNATVVRKDGTIATIPAADLFKTPEDASKVNGGDDINKPNAQTVVADMATLSPEERTKVKDAIKAKVEAVNPGAVVVVDDKGNAIVTTPEGKTAVIDADDLIKKPNETSTAKAGNNINNPADRVQVADKAELTEPELGRIKAAVEAVNPGATVVVDDKGNATVTTPEGKTATIPVADLVKTSSDKENVSGGNQVNTPADRVVVENPAALNDTDKEKIKAEILKVNPGAEVVFDTNGNATVTNKDGVVATIPATDLVKAKTELADPTKQDAVNKPADKVVVDPELVDNADVTLPQTAKDAIKAAVEAVNPDSTVVVDDKGNATVTTPEGKTVVIPKADLVRKEADKETAKAGNNINKPADRVLVTDPTNIDEAAKKAIEEKVKAVNPDATVVVDAKGNATVTTPEGKTATIPVADLVKTATDAENTKAGNNVNKPADKVTANKDNLQPADKDKIKEAILKVNPEGTKVFVDDKGNATVSTPDGKTATIPVEDLVKAPTAKDEVNGGNKVNTPADKVVVANPAELTTEDKDKIAEKIKAVNPDAKVVFDDKGNATVTTKDGAVATIPASDLVKTNNDLTDPAKQDAVKKPADKTLVKNPAKLSQEEKDAIKVAVAKVNPENTTVVVDEQGNATVTTPDGKTEVIPASDLVKTAKEAEGANAGNNINKPADKVSATPADLTGDKKDEVKAKIQKAVESVNPGATVFVDDKGNATVTTSDGKTATIPVEDLLKDPAAKETPSAGNKVNTPAEKALVDPSVLNDPNATLPKDVKDAIQKAVESVNPGAKVVVDDKGNATVTTPDGKTATIPASDLVKSNAKEDLENAAKQDAVKKPIDETVVADKDALTPEEKKAIADKVKEVNPGASVYVDEKGNATVTTPEGKTAVIPADDLVKTEDEVLTDPKAGNVINKPADGVFAKDGQITDDVKAKIAAKVQRVNPNSTVFVDDKGNATVTTPEGKTATIPVADLTKTDAEKAKVNAGNKINSPADRVLVKDRDKLTAEDIQEIEKNILEVNPGATVVFDAKGNATVKNANGDIATIPVEDLAKPKAYLLNPEKQDLIKKPVDKVLDNDPDKTAKIKKAVEEVNPGSTVVVDDKGNATITTEDGKSFVIPAKDLVKTEAEAANEKAGNNINKPADKVSVKDKDQLTEDDKKAIAAKVKAVNPGAEVFVDDKGNATVTLKDGKSATIPATDLVKSPEDATKPNATNKVNTPADKVVVKDPDTLTDTDKQAIIKKIQEVNPEAKVVFDKYGNATVTTKDGAVATIPAKDLVKTEVEVAKPEAGNNVNKPADKAVVANPEQLTDAEKEAVKKAVEAANPGSTVVVDDKGNATVTTPEGKTAVIPATDLTKSVADAAKPNAGNDIVKPAEKTVVANPEQLTDAEKEAVKKAVESVNPDSTVVVDDKGNATVTTKDGKTAVIPASDLTKSAADAAKPNAGNDVNTPADKTVVANPEQLTDAEKKAIADKVSAVNPGATVVVDDKGNATVTTKDGKTAVIPATDLTKSAADAAKPNAGNDVVKPADKTLVKNPEQLSDEEKQAITDKLTALNPEAKVVVDDKGNATVTTKDGKPVVIPASDLTKTEAQAKEPKAGNDIVKPVDKTVVVNSDSLTQDEKDAIAAKVKAVNSGAEVVVDDKGNATVTLPNGKTAVIPASDLTKNADAEKAPKAGNDIVKPASKVLVKDPESLTKDEKDAIAAKVAAVNPGSTVVVDDKGNATVTTPEGKTAVIPASDLTKTEKDVNDGKAKDNAITPAAKTKVANPNQLTDAEKKAIEDKVKVANPGAEVFVDDKGNATVVKDGNVSVIPASDLVKVEDDAKKDNGGNDANTPAAKTVVKDLANLTDEEKAKVKKAVEAVNPGATVVVDEKGNATVTKADGTVLNIPATDLVIPADNLADEAKNAKVKTPAFRTLVRDKENLTDAEKEAVKKAIEVVNPGATVVVDEKGNATVTLPDGSTATISKDQLVKDKEDAKAKHGGDNLELDLSKVTVTNLANITPEEKVKFQFMILGAITDVEEFDSSTLEKSTDDKGNTVYASKDGKVKITIDKDGNATIEKDGKKELAVNIDKAGNVTIVTKEGKVLAIPRDDAFRQKETPNLPEKVGVVNKTNLTDAEKEAVKAALIKANPKLKDANITISATGEATIVYSDGQKVVIPADKLVEEKLSDSNGNAELDINLPEKVAVGDVNNLTDAEKEAVKAALVKANPKLKDAKITISAKGEATIVYPDGKVVVIPAANLVVAKGANNNAGTNANVGAKATDVDSKDKDVNVKAGQRLANTGATETNTGLAGLGLGILGGLLAAVRRRKEK